MADNKEVTPQEQENTPVEPKAVEEIPAEVVEEPPVVETVEVASVESEPEVAPILGVKSSEVPFRAGDTVRIIYKIVEGNEVRRTQPFEGIVISKKGMGVSKTFTVRRIGADNVGVERIFPLFSPNLESITILKKGKVRRAKLYYSREKTGKAAIKVKEQA